MLGLIIFLAVVALVFVGVYNGLVGKRVSADSAWSQIEVQLKRRYDLIPNLVEIVKGYAAHEKQTLEAVIKARNAAISTSPGAVGDKAQAETALTGALRQVFALAESYPDLKANQNFSQLQEEIASTENRISFSRQHYNDSVAVYNAAREQIPGNLVVGFGNFPAKQFFELEASQKQAVQEPPRVSFS